MSDILLRAVDITRRWGGLVAVDRAKRAASCVRPVKA